MAQESRQDRTEPQFRRDLRHGKRIGLARFHRTGPFHRTSPAMNAVHWAAMAVLAVMMIGNTILCRQYLKTIREWERYKESREKLLDHLANPQEFKQKLHAPVCNCADCVGQSDFSERTADILEARAANRLTAPRPDAGPPAIVHRPRGMRAKLPTRWNPPADYFDPRRKLGQ